MHKLFQAVLQNQQEFQEFCELVPVIKYEWMFDFDKEMPPTEFFPIHVCGDRFGKVTQTMGYVEPSFELLTLDQFKQKEIEWFQPIEVWENAKIILTDHNHYNHVMNFVVDANGYTYTPQLCLTILKKTPVLILKEDGTAEFITLKQSTQKKYSHYPLRNS